MSTIKIEMTEADVRKAIAEYINAHYNWVEPHIYDDDVKIRVGRQYEDRPGGGHTEVFQKAVITVKLNDE